MDSVVQALLQLGIAGVMSASVVGTLYYILSKTIPAMLTRFSEEARLEREACEKRHQENLVRHEATYKAVIEAREHFADSFKEQRHAINDWAHAARLKEMVSEIKKKPT